MYAMALMSRQSIRDRTLRKQCCTFNIRLLIRDAPLASVHRLFALGRLKLEKMLSIFRKTETSRRFIPLFIGGAPRTGTTALHALICTSPSTNGYVGECSYLSAFVHPLLVGLQTFDVHTKHYFDSEDSFLQHHGSIVSGLLSHFWQRLGRPKLLTLKSPPLTPHFHLMAKMLEDARFVVIARDPYDTISSRIEVMRRQKGGTAPTESEVQEVCLEYTGTYAAILNHATTFRNRLCVVDYESLVSGNKFSKLEEFGITGIRSDRMWLDAITDVKQYSDDEWATPLYGHQLTSESVGRHSRILTPEFKAIISNTCDDVARQIANLSKG